MISEPIKKVIEISNLYNVKSILEIGCGKGGILAQFHAPVKIGIDMHGPYLDIAKAKHPEALYLQHDITRIWEILRPNSFDMVIGFDILEHLREEDMQKMILTAEELSRKIVAFFSPLGKDGLCMHTEDEDTVPGMRHVTMIREEDFTRRGYRAWKWNNYYGNMATALLAIKEM